MEHKGPVVMRQTEHDEFLMPLFVKHGYRDNDLHLLNQCQCFLRALTVANVLVVDSSKVCEDSWLGVREVNWSILGLKPKVQLHDMITVDV